MSRFDMIEAMIEDDLAGEETCDLCAKVAGLHNYEAGWYFCPPEHNDAAIVERSPNLGTLAKQVQGNHRMFRREDAQDGGTENGTYPRRR